MIAKEAGPKDAGPNDAGPKDAGPKDSSEVLSALRLGWALAELRGRNRPGGPTGDIAPMPDRVDHPLPLRIERGPTELRIESQAVVAALALKLRVDASDHRPSFGVALDELAKLLDHTRARTSATALQNALTLLEANDVVEALSVLRVGQTEQRAVVKSRMEALDAARSAGAAELRIEKGCLAGEARGLAALDEVIVALKERGPTVGIEAVRLRQHAIGTDAARLWASLAELIWEFDAHAQDALSAGSETQAIAYQLGRGLAEIYWALDPEAADGTRSWGFLLGPERCSELGRLIGRLSAYLDEYTGPAIVGSLEVWKDVVRTPAWLGDRRDTAKALYKQIRRWFELLVLRQDPTTLVPSALVTKDYRALRRALRPFLPQIIGVGIGVGFLIALLILVSLGDGPPWLKTVSGIVGVGGISIAGLTAALKNSAQAMLTRWRQDSYTDLVATAVLTAPPAPKNSDVRTALRRRRLTPATPN
jgi:hypothetical protein